MKRENLKELGLTDDQVEKIMSQHGADIEKLKGSFEDYDTLKTENESLQKQLKDNEDVSNQLKDWQDKYAKDTENLTTELNQTRLNAALDKRLSSEKVRNPKAAKALLDLENVKLTKDGDLDGIDDQISDIKQSDPYLFDEGSKSNYNPAGGNGGTGESQVSTLIDAFQN